MSIRACTLTAADKMISRVKQIAVEADGFSAVGVIYSEPQSPGTVPGKVIFSVDLSHQDNVALEDNMDNKRKPCCPLL